ncbi:MAG: hypothetical protein CMF39_05880 [Legionellaceae bacterium]|nr:hypothetical protein [Legionellaceae bacterium]
MKKVSLLVLSGALLMGGAMAASSQADMIYRVRTPINRTVPTITVNSFSSVTLTPSQLKAAQNTPAIITCCRVSSQFLGPGWLTSPTSSANSPVS